MPDIAMCNNDSCPLAFNCERYVAIPNEPWQSYADYRYRMIAGRAFCDDFVPLKLEVTDVSTC